MSLHIARTFFLTLALLAGLATPVSATPCITPAAPSPLPIPYPVVGASDDATRLERAAKAVQAARDDAFAAGRTRTATLLDLVAEALLDSIYFNGGWDTQLVVVTDNTIIVVVQDADGAEFRAAIPVQETIELTVPSSEGSNQ